MDTINCKHIKHGKDCKVLIANYVTASFYGVVLSGFTCVLLKDKISCPFQEVISDGHEYTEDDIHEMRVERGE